MNATDVAQNIKIWDLHFYIFISVPISCKKLKIWTGLLVIFYCVLNVYCCFTPRTDLIEPQKIKPVLGAQTTLLYVQVQISTGTQ